MDSLFGHSATCRVFVTTESDLPPLERDKVKRYIKKKCIKIIFTKRRISPVETNGQSTNEKMVLLVRYASTPSSPVRWIRSCPYSCWTRRQTSYRTYDKLNVLENNVGKWTAKRRACKKYRSVNYVFSKTVFKLKKCLTNYLNYPVLRYMYASFTLLRLFCNKKNQNHCTRIFRSVCVMFFTDRLTKITKSQHHITRYGKFDFPIRVKSGPPKMSG